MEQNWQALVQGYGRDYSWLTQALALYAGSAKTAENAAVVSLVPNAEKGIEGDFGWQYGLVQGCRLHFLLENSTQPAQTDAWQGLLPTVTSAADWFCIPVKTGSPALGWQLGLRLGAVRPLALLRPFYLFCAPQFLASQGAIRRVAAQDIRRLGRLLDSGWAGVDRCPLAGEILLQKRIQPGPCV